MAAPLDNSQKRYLSQLARRAWLKLGAELDGQAETDFRREHVAKATGKFGLRCCSQDDYGAAKAHFLELLGESGHALNALVHQQGNAQRIAMHKLKEACHYAHVSLEYPAAICRQQFKCNLSAATDKQLWCLTFTVKNRARKVTFGKDAI